MCCFLVTVGIGLKHSMHSNLDVEDSLGPGPFVLILAANPLLKRLFSKRYKGTLCVRIENILAEVRNRNRTLGLGYSSFGELQCLYYTWYAHCSSEALSYISYFSAAKCIENKYWHVHMLAIFLYEKCMELVKWKKIGKKMQLEPVKMKRLTNARAKVCYTGGKTDITAPGK